MGAGIVLKVCLTLVRVAYMFLQLWKQSRDPSFLRTSLMVLGSSLEHGF